MVDESDGQVNESEKSILKAEEMKNEKPGSASRSVGLGRKAK